MKGERKMAVVETATLFDNVDSQTEFVCRHFEMKPAPKEKRSTSLYTSRNVKKATEDEPIRSLEHIKEAQDYFLTTGKTRWYRMRNYMLFVLGISTGLRGCDLLDLKIGDVLNENGTIKNYILLIEQKTRKTNRPRINNAAKEAIVKYLDCLEEIDFDEYLIRSERKNNANHGKMDTTQLYRIMHKLNTDLGFEEHIGAHSLRKTFGYWNLKLHPDDPQALAVLQQMLNHSSSQTTLRYCGFTREDKDVFYSDIESIFSDAKLTKVVP